jgi:hypothetical protein
MEWCLLVGARIRGLAVDRCTAHVHDAPDAGTRGSLVHRPDAADDHAWIAGREMQHGIASAERRFELIAIEHVGEPAVEPEASGPRHRAWSPHHRPHLERAGQVKELDGAAADEPAGAKDRNLQHVTLSAAASVAAFASASVNHGLFKSVRIR